jgi:hypothetical protein
MNDYVENAPSTVPPSGRPVLDKSEKAVDVVLAEYAALKTEINSRSSYQHHIVNWVLVVTGALLAVGLERQEVALLLIAPILTFFLVVRYADHSAQIARMGDYIQRRIEKCLPDLGWEEWLPSEHARPRVGQKGLLAVVTSRGTFLTMEALPVVVGLVRFFPELLQIEPSMSSARALLLWLLLAGDIVIMALTWRVLTHRRYKD